MFQIQERKWNVATLANVLLVLLVGNRIYVGEPGMKGVSGVPGQAGSDGTFGTKGWKFTVNQKSIFTI